MTEFERKDHQLNIARELSKGMVTTPCVSISSRAEVESVIPCPFLNIESGCQKGEGFIMEPGKSVSCPDGKGEIRIGNERIKDVLKPHQIYSLQIANEQVDSGLAERAAERTALFI